MKKFFLYLKNHPLIKAVLLMTILISIILVLVFFSLKKFTHLGEEVSMPDFTGLYYNELESQQSNHTFVFEISDSVYDTKKEKGTIIRQDPIAGEKVKKGRRVYLTTVAFNREQVEMPNLKDLSLRLAISMLNAYGLELANLRYESGIGTDVIIDQEYLGTPIDSGTMVEKGSAITLVVSNEQSNSLINIPFLVGKSKNQALQILYSNSLNLGEEFFEDSEDSSKIVVYKQSPRPSNSPRIRRGATIKIWYKDKDKFDFNGYLKSYRKDSIINESDSTLNEDPIQ